MILSSTFISLGLDFGLICSSQEEPDLVLFAGGDSLSPQNVMEHGRQLAEQMGARLQTGW